VYVRTVLLVGGCDLPLVCVLPLPERVSLIFIAPREAFACGVFLFNDPNLSAIGNLPI
jgi:hypothetical protein